MSDGFKFAYLKALHGRRFPRGIRLTLVTILDYANADGENAFPGERRLAADCCVSVRTIQRHVAWLLEHGWLIEVSRGRKYGGASVYSVAYGTIPGDETEAAESPVEAVEAATYTEPFGELTDAAACHAAATAAPLRSDAETCWHAGCWNPAAYDSQLCAEHEHLRCESSWDATPIRPTDPVGV